METVISDNYKFILSILTLFPNGGGAKKDHSEISHAYPTLMKLGSYTLPKEDQKNQYFLTEIQKLLLYQEIQIYVAI